MAQLKCLESFHLAGDGKKKAERFIQRGKLYDAKDDACKVAPHRFGAVDADVPDLLSFGPADFTDAQHAEFAQEQPAEPEVETES